MERVGIYPGSFNPWHKGHRDILDKALKVFDRIYIVLMQNEEKETNLTDACLLAAKLSSIKNVELVQGKKSLCETIDKIMINDDGEYLYNKRYAVIRGLRNGNDLQYEMNNQYWNEDIGVGIPFVYFIANRELSHVSSSAIRSLNKLGLHNDY